MTGISFLSPWRLLLLVVVVALAVVYVLFQRRRSAYAVRFTNLELLESVAPKRPGWRRHLTAAVQLVALATLVVAFAQPTREVKVPRERATVVLAIDVSLSMEATDVLPTRIQAAKTAAKKFAGLLPSRINLGVVSFARGASVIVPPTVDRNSVDRGIDSLKLDNYTAIGEGIFISLDAIKQSKLSKTLFRAVGYGTEVRKAATGPQNPVPRDFPLIRRYVDMPGQKLTPQVLQTNGNEKDPHGTGGTCFGDSGGPVFLDGEVVAVTSYGNNNVCRGIAGYQRVDIGIAQDWLATFGSDS